MNEIYLFYFLLQIDLPKSKSYGILTCRDTGGDGSIAKAIRPITYKARPSKRRSFLLGHEIAGSFVAVGPSFALLL
jgi:hypothetical protein